MKKILSLMIGIAAILSLFVLNFSHAANNYGILNNKLHLEVLAQTNTGSGPGNGSSTSGSGSGSTTGGITNPWFYRKVETSQQCSAFKVNGEKTVIVMGVSTSYTGGSVSGSMSGSQSTTVVFSYTGHIYACRDGWTNFSCEVSCAP